MPKRDELPHSRLCCSCETCLQWHVAGVILCHLECSLRCTTCCAGCSQQIDVVFILDISGSIQEKYDNALMLAANVTCGLDIDSGNVRVAAVAYSTSPLGQFYLRDYTRRETVLTALRFYNPGGSTNTAAALDEVRTKHFTASYGSRSGVRKVNTPYTATIISIDFYLSSLFLPDLNHVKQALYR